MLKEHLVPPYYDVINIRHKDAALCKEILFNSFNKCGEMNLNNNFVLCIGQGVQDKMSNII